MINRLTATGSNRIFHPGLMLSLSFVLVLSACSAQGSVKDPQRIIKVGFSLDSLVVERWQRDLEIFKATTTELGAELLVKVANQDASVQEKQIRQLMDQGIDVLVVVPNDAEQLGPIIAEVKSRGIPVMSYDRLVRNAQVDLYISFDNEMVGAIMARTTLSASKGGNFVIINGASSDNNSNFLNAGIKKVLEPAIKSGKVKIIAEIWPKTWDSGEVRSQLDDLLATKNRIDVVIAGNDMLAEAAINVLAENRLMDNVLVAGQDADLAACQRIAEGTQFLTIYKPIDTLARNGARLAVDLARGTPVEAMSTVHDGKYLVPFVHFDPVAVLRESLHETVIADGFHLAADVFRFVNTQE